MVADRALSHLHGALPTDTCSRTHARAHLKDPTTKSPGFNVPRAVRTLPKTEPGKCDFARKVESPLHISGQVQTCKKMPIYKVDRRHRKDAERTANTIERLKEFFYRDQ